MKTSVVLLITVLMALLSLREASAQAGNGTAPRDPSLLILAWKGVAPTTPNSVVVTQANPGVALGGPKLKAPGTSADRNGPKLSLPRGLPSTNQFYLRSRRLPPSLPKPGVYEAWPYTMIVVVPGLHPDERGILGPETAQPRMPTVTPELRLIPRAAR